ncbi:MAG: ATP-binding protein [Sphaerochaeta sp.]
MYYIQRAMERLIAEITKEYPVILLTGPRQCGKTTMLLKLMDDAKNEREYVSLDDLTLRALAKNDPVTFFQLHKPPLMIDEVQYAPELFPYIKMIVDKNHEPGLFYLAGSQLFKRMEGVKESLAGRVALLHLSPLANGEILGRQDIRPFEANLEMLSDRQQQNKSVTVTDIFSSLHRGSMPALVSGKYSKPDLFYSSYIGTYLDRDVKELSGTIDSLKFTRFLTACAARSSQLLNYKGIGEDAEIDQSTAKSWLRILETLGIIFYLHPYSNNVLKRVVKTPKLYFYDTGLICYLTRWTSAETAMNGAMNGALLENYVISEVMKSYQNEGLNPPLYYYRDKDNKEIDLVIDRDGKLYPIEIKKTAMPDKNLVKVFSVLTSQDSIRGTGAIVCTVETLGAFDKDNLIVPIGLL